MPFMEAKSSLPCSQKPVTDPYPEPAESIPHLHIVSFKIHLGIIPPFVLSF